MHCDFPRTTGGGRSPDFKTMRACVLHDVRALAVRNVPTPQLGPRDVLLRVAAVGLCGTDLHIYQGEANYNMDERGQPVPLTRQDRKSTRLNSSHVSISYAVFCLKKK